MDNDEIRQHRRLGIALVEEWGDALEEIELDRIIRTGSEEPPGYDFSKQLDVAYENYDRACFASMWPGPLESGWEGAIDIMQWSDN